MQWINIDDSHFVDLKIEKKDSSIEYSWTELSSCPQEPFLVGVDTNTGFQWAKVILTEFGIEEVSDDDTQPWGWSVMDIQYWMEIETPTDGLK